MPKHGRNVIGRKRGANGFLAQARADLQVAEVVAASGLATSTLAMLLQMVFEKLAKAALLRMRSISVAHATSTHATAGRLLRTLQHERRRFAMLAAISGKGIASWCRQRAGPKPDLRAGARFPLIKRCLGRCRTANRSPAARGLLQLSRCHHNPTSRRGNVQASLIDFPLELILEILETISTDPVIVVLGRVSLVEVAVILRKLGVAKLAMIVLPGLAVSPVLLEEQPPSKQVFFLAIPTPIIAGRSLTLFAHLPSLYFFGTIEPSGKMRHHSLAVSL